MWYRIWLRKAGEPPTVETLRCTHAPVQTVQADGIIDAAAVHERWAGRLSRADATALAIGCGICSTMRTAPFVTLQAGDVIEDLHDLELYEVSRVFDARRGLVRLCPIAAQKQTGLAVLSLYDRIGRGWDETMHTVHVGDYADVRDLYERLTDTMAAHAPRPGGRIWLSREYAEANHAAL